MNGIAEGVKAAVGGAWFVFTTPRTWPWAAVPAVILLLLTCGLSGLGIWGAGWLNEQLVGQPETWYGYAGAWLLYVLLIVTAVTAALLLGLVLTQPLSGFALEAISLAQERALVGAASAEASFLLALYVSLKAALVTVPVAVVSFGVLFTIDFFFPPAVIVTIPLKFLVAGWLLAWNFVDYPLSLRGLGVRRRLNWMIDHFAAVTAFGLFWALLLPVPGLGLLVLPLGVAGATRLVVASNRPAPRGPTVVVVNAGPKSLPPP